MSKADQREISFEKARQLLSLVQLYKMPGQSGQRVSEEDLAKIDELATPEVAILLAQELILLGDMVKTHVKQTNKQLKQLIGE
ncbi:hypothetical protein NRE35_004207 [Salmonella enterica]|nr:hypothetical protein [Salmonella enterica subsp. enterica serovar Oslo]EEX4841303.1 hypothetical protein [Escherichia coli]EJO2543841.1 hypothetical protein [Salmonella enterica]